MFLYWGRRGAIAKFARDVQAAALEDETVAPTLSISNQNESFSSYREFGDSLFAVDTFTRSAGALKGLWRIGQLRRALRKRFAQDGTQAVIALMPHVWTPFLVDAGRDMGVRYATVVHDATPHPGDSTALALRLLLMEAKRADQVITLSRHVTGQLAARTHRPPGSTTTLFHPDFDYGGGYNDHKAAPDGPLRLLWFGRILPYKGLSMFVDALEIARAQGTPLQVSVYGAGTLGAGIGERLSALGAKVVNRWLAEDEVPVVLAAHDAVALTHLEASQSGVVAAAFGAGLPVIATPVGGLVEQVEDGINGVLSRDTSALGFAAALGRMGTDPVLFAQLRANLAARPGNSMARFVRQIVDAVLGLPIGSSRDD